MSEMTYERWNMMSIRERRDWNRPAFESLGQGVIEFMGDDNEWFECLGFGLDYPHRVKPIDPPVAQPEPVRDIPTQAERRAAWVAFAAAALVGVDEPIYGGVVKIANSMLDEYDKRFGGAK